MISATELLVQLDQEGYKLNRRQLRHMEERGLLQGTLHSEGRSTGVRTIFPDSTLTRVRYALELRGLGLTGDRLVSEFRKRFR